MAFLQVKPISATDYNNAIDALTVSFNFKTVTAEGIMFYGKGRTSNDYIMVQIASKKRLRGEINLGSQADFVDINISGNFDDNKAHSVFLEFNRKELKLTVDGITKSVQRNPLSMSHLDLEGDPMYLGGGFDVTEGFTGCISGLVSDIINCIPRISSNRIRTVCAYNDSIYVNIMRIINRCLRLQTTGFLERLYID